MAWPSPATWIGFLARDVFDEFGIGVAELDAIVPDLIAAADAATPDPWPETESSALRWERPATQPRVATFCSRQPRIRAANSVDGIAR